MGRGLALFLVMAIMLASSVSVGYAMDIRSTTTSVETSAAADFGLLDDITESEGHKLDLRVSYGVPSRGYMSLYDTHETEIYSDGHLITVGLHWTDGGTDADPVCIRTQYFQIRDNSDRLAEIYVASSFDLAPAGLHLAARLGGPDEGNTNPYYDVTGAGTSIGEVELSAEKDGNGFYTATFGITYAFYLEYPIPRNDIPVAGIHVDVDAMRWEC